MAGRFSAAPVRRSRRGNGSVGALVVHREYPLRGADQADTDAVDADASGRADGQGVEVAQRMPRHHAALTTRSQAGPSSAITAAGKRPFSSLSI